MCLRPRSLAAVAVGMLDLLGVAGELGGGVVGEGPFGEPGAVLADRLHGGNQEHPGIFGHVEGFVVDEVAMLKAAGAGRTARLMICGGSNVRDPSPGCRAITATNSRRSAAASRCCSPRSTGASSHQVS